MGYVFFIALITSIILFSLKKWSFQNNLIQKVFLIVSVLFFGYYFGLISLIKILLLLLTSFLFGYKILNFKNDLISGFFASLFIFLQFYIVSSLILNPQISLIILFILFLPVFLYKYHFNSKAILFAVIQLRNYASKLNIIDLFIIILSFLLSSLPQNHWDAVQANLYNAKWYINNNSLAPLQENISSLFPQNAILYYALFYHLGGVKALQISYLLPLITLIFLFKKFVSRIKLNTLSRGLLYCLLTTPIVIFQSANGYYDLLLTIILLVAIYISYFQINSNYQINLFTSSFLMGFAAGTKYFPILFIFLPLINYYFYSKFKPNLKKLIMVSSIVLLVSLFPLLIWIVRAYLYTGSPVYPYFQSFFPSPQFWPEGDVLEKNFMIQTTLSGKLWILGGFLIYPFLTFFKTESFLEAVKGYTGLIYILITLFQIIWFILFLKKRRLYNLKKIDVFYLYSFFVYFFVGLISRYYRYLWPYQFIFSIFLILALRKFNFWQEKIIFRITILILFLNIIFLPYFFKYFPINKKLLLRPDFYFTSKQSIDPVTFLNNQIKNKKLAFILDASMFHPGRFNFSGRVYQCNWYWIGILEELSRAVKNKMYANTIMKKYDYILTGNPLDQSDKTCINLIKDNISLLQEVYQDKYYIIYKVKK